MVAVDVGALPTNFPTHRHEPAFWERLGRTVATFGFLEEVLGKAIFAFSARRHETSDEAFEAWLREPRGLERALTDPLAGLVGQLEQVVVGYSATGAAGLEDLEDLLGLLREASRVRNVLCHGSWRPPDETGASKPLFVERKGGVFETAIDCAYLDQVRQHVVELACAVIDLVTSMGWQFPSSRGPGVPVLDR